MKIQEYLRQGNEILSLFRIRLGNSNIEISPLYTMGDDLFLTSKDIETMQDIVDLEKREILAIIDHENQKITPCNSSIDKIFREVLPQINQTTSRNYEEDAYRKFTQKVYSH